MSPPPCTAGPDDELIAVTLRREFRPDERVDLDYFDAPGALAERQAVLPVVGVHASHPFESCWGHHRRARV
jgi:hypothetical protein